MLSVRNARGGRRHLLACADGGCVPDECDQIARLLIGLEGIEPVIWRQVEVSLTATLKALHEVIQASFGWEGHHLHVFKVGEDRRVVPDPEWHAPHPLRSEKTKRLTTLIEHEITSFRYTYAFGDDWRHKVEIEAVATADHELEYPCFIGGMRRASPEDVGGVLGYEEFVQAISRPCHCEHKAMLAWYGRPYDPDDIGEAEVVDVFGKRHRREPSVARPTSRARVCRIEVCAQRYRPTTFGTIHHKPLRNVG